ncbi:cysteine synthase A [Lujinxingia litoralis]|uniref:cysteine synthase n=1 Tax=Lujinxingia litoralis TaxID=2211119 RepID=A0A328C2A3_9DELT|nr:cysteine synthase A [Lujinxingia litoralis]RAL20554.1 cysteine synthase A [Lujinxingia litoralis]
MVIHQSIVELVGHTPLIRLSKVVGDCPAEIVGKAEFFNPLGSVKDRVGAALVADAEARGALKPGGLIVEPTSGNTGIALAFVCASRGYRLILTMPDTMSLERRTLLKALGAELVLTPGSLGMQGAVEEARNLVEKTPGAIMLQQFQNPANPRSHARTTAEEIWESCQGQVDAIVTGVGTGGTITGVARALKEKNPAFKAIALEPAGSPVLSGGAAGPHKVQGIGAGFVPDIFDPELIDEVLTIEDDEAFEMSRRLAREEGLLVGISAGANVVGALRVGRRPEFAGKRIVTMLCDTGERYLSTPLFREL